ncbi:MAG: CopG family transcriptional regulator [Candidatus Xenobia bacterium]
MALQRRNVTLSLPRDLVKDARRLAAEKGTSLSALMTEALETMVRDRQAYDEAMQVELALMETGLDLGTRGRIQSTRDDLHER